MATMTDTTLLPYERQPGESAKAYAAFVIFRNLGPERSVLKAYRQKTGKEQAKQAAGLWNSWATDHHWHKRADAWDAHLDEENRKAQEQARRGMAERHATMAMGLQRKALERLQKMEAQELAASDVLRYLVEAAKLERLARGEPEEIQEQRHTDRDGQPLADRTYQVLQALVESVAAFPEARIRLAERLRHEASLLRNPTNGDETTTDGENGQASQ
jgi:hypothetical protein